MTVHRRVKSENSKWRKIGYKPKNYVKDRIILKTQGSNHPQWKGYWVTPCGIFETLEKASKAHPEISKATVAQRVRSKNFPNWHTSKEKV